ncbi:hypothetical protein niasHS_008865 [Heterodera schachtii]|uniref:Secreted protein n=1 Tax=Heterodera schachtii TaxID=97005 RepID=A0ABD2J4V0_HETSC
MASCKSPISLLSVLLTMLLIDPCFNYVFFLNPAGDDCVVAVRNRTQAPSGLDEYVYGILIGEEQREAAREADAFRNTFTADCMPFGEAGELWGSFWGCQTFTCKDEHGKDIFRINGCAERKDRKCSKMYYTYCIKLGGLSFCSHCDDLVDGKVCNSFDQLINLDQSDDQLNSILKSNTNSTSKAEKLGPASAFTWISSNLLLIFVMVFISWH